MGGHASSDGGVIAAVCGATAMSALRHSGRPHRVNCGRCPAAWRTGQIRDSGTGVDRTWAPPAAPPSSRRPCRQCLLSPSTSQAPSLFSLGRHAEFRALLVEKGRKTGEFRTPKFEFRTRIGLRLAFTRGSRPVGMGGVGGRTRAFVYKSDTQPRRGLHTAVQASDRVPQVVGHDQVAHSAPTAWLERGPQRVRRWHGASPATGGGALRDAPTGGAAVRVLARMAIEH